MIKKIIQELYKKAHPVKAKILARFFKTGKGEYGEGDKFLGITVPEQRKIAKDYYQNISLNEIKMLLTSKIHEFRLTALIMLTYKYKKANEEERKQYFEFYLKNTKSINNWDMVDLTAPNIVGEYLFNKDREIIYKLTKSKNLWEKRIAILSTYAFIRHGQFDDIIKVAKILINDQHDLIQKAVGWMLRETGKRNIKTEEEFLQKNYRKMGRTALRYAIEKFPEKKRKLYLNNLFKPT
ncbi:DNA alkylation repair protein [Candidatus Roizmanbacteria bacterium CG_4_10_14_0_2_um_filter_36_35]|uniref:DNA alkylation repair protein n=5 Tax=Candidatus Roizmaniibacteriota TaxID=1752723 RepID=A0A2M7BY09_9BACT|nr:MAG: DNA alkylation repair protein [Candidatus Roizmanbacteria bacterium CG11_big_fil_rev_8_21_14_0_20_35_14]PIV11461.1 MAG: DNA alkylation repair protein [Candidatus Roizmanbacteria bacterium CG03_land_8_20_14_0_80_35_26]PIZ68275.1 MAG: DNA alkylation repair protein [Candidatus Roizmanbacteria bacterium CG_4_10_14_0_2_um_filter_36_35]PJC32889.1 MAG: DNA alkylation repair protein [Candidatus Roizmanbacteria bacterium CG_4_9_14_0_2_um_filter_36_12]PJC80550.1 MAG: DNA alkylation repair protein